MHEFEPYISEEDIKLMEIAFEEAQNHVQSGRVGDCPLCRRYGRSGGAIFEGDRSFYCRNATEKNGKSCGFILYKNNIKQFIRREITQNEVMKLCESERFCAICTKVGGSRKYEGIFHIKEKGKYISLELTFPGRK